MTLNPPTLKTSQLQTNQMELCDELSRLNSSLKQELDKCHQYIHTLQRDLHEVEERSNYSMISEGSNNFSENIEVENNHLREEVGRLGLKVKEKRVAVKRMEKHCQGLESYVHQVVREKEEIQRSLTRFQCLLEGKGNDQKENMRRLQATIKEQREAILLSTRQAQEKASGLERMHKKIQEMESERANYKRQNQQLRQMNQNLSLHLSEVEKYKQQRELMLTAELKQMQSTNTELGNEIKRLIIQKQRCDEIIQQMALRSGSRKDEEVREMALENRRLAEEIKRILEQKRIEREKYQWLKNEIITVKLENSSLHIKNKCLNEEKSQLQKRNHQLISNPNSTLQPSIDTPSLKSIKSCSKTLTSISTISTKKLSPIQDGQIPVQDNKSNPNPNPHAKPTNKSSLLYLPDPVESKKNNLLHRHKIINFASII